MMRVGMFWTLIVVSGLVLSGCRREPGADLMDTAWRLAAVEPAGPETVPTWPPLSLSFTAGGIGGNTGCNSYGAAYEVEGDRLVVREVSRTLAECTTPALTAREMAFFDGLLESGDFTVDEQSLTIETEQGALRFVPLEDRTASVDAVYQALLREWDDGSQRFFVVVVTIPGPPSGNVTAAIEQAFDGEVTPRAELVADYELKNRDPRLLEPTDAPVTFLGGEVWQEAMSAGAAWEEVSSSAPPEASAVFAFSDVAFNEAGDEALVYVQRLAPGDSGGYFHWLRLGNGVWTSVRAGRVWGPGS